MIGLLVLNLTTGLGLGEVQALGRHFTHRRVPDRVLWRVAEAEGDLADFAPLGPGALAIREGGLSSLEGGNARPIGPPLGLLRLFPRSEGGFWVAGTYYRVLGWDVQRGLHHLVSVSGPVREIRSVADRLAVAVEGNALESGRVRFFRRKAPEVFEAEGLDIEIALDRWSGFELSPDGGRMLANLPGRKGVGVWDTAEGRLLASWPCERLARVLAWVDSDRVIFDRGPIPKGRAGIYAHPENRLLLARVDGSEAPRVVAANFATILASMPWPDHSRLAFADMEGLIRVVALGPSPALADTLAPRDRGIPWRLRPDGDSLWVLFKGEEIRVERYGVK
jgi:hypothetical protein